MIKYMSLEQLRDYLRNLDDVVKEGMDWNMAILGAFDNPLEHLKAVLSAMPDSAKAKADIRWELWLELAPAQSIEHMKALFAAMPDTTKAGMNWRQLLQLAVLQSCDTTQLILAEMPGKVKTDIAAIWAKTAPEELFKRSELQTFEGQKFIGLIKTMRNSLRVIS